MIKNIILLISLFNMINTYADSSFLEGLNETINQNKERAIKLNRKIASLEKEHKVSISIGQYFIFSEYNDFIDNSFGTQIGYIYYNEMPVNFHFDVGYVADQGNSIMSIKPGFAYKLIRKNKLTLEPIAGLGFYHLNIEDVSDLIFGFHLGAKITLSLNKKYDVQFSTSYNNPFDSSKLPNGSYHNLLLGVNYSY
jgi:hypothetical protein